MKKNLFYIVILSFAFNLLLFAQDPGGISGANLWLKSDAGVTTTSGTQLDQDNSGWTDQTSKQTTTVHGIMNLSSNGVNFNPTINFGANAFVSVDYTANLNTTSFTIYTVVKSTGGSGYRAVVSSKSTTVDGYVIYINPSGQFEFWIGNGSSWQTINGGAVTTDEWYLITAKFGSSTSTFYVNGEQVATSGSVTLSANTSDQFRFGAGHNSGGSADFYFQGEMPEFVYYPSALSASDQNQIESYLAAKYGISLGNNSTAVDYKSSGTTTIWTNTTYKYDIFGIGQDNNSSLNQTSSNSMFTGGGDGTGQSGEGNIVISSASDMADGEFLFIGNDNGSLTYSGSNLNATFANYQRVGRQWIVDKTNDVGTIRLEFDMTGITTVASSTASDYALLYDTDDDLSDVTTKVDASSISGNVITFNTLSLTDGDRITFMAKNTALPVEISSFSGIATNEGILLQWETATEVNNFGFEIECTNDNISWEVKGFVNGSGTTNSPESYSFNDSELPNTDEVSYRLKQIDNEGTFTYSKTITIDLTNITSVEEEGLPKEYSLSQNYPNPFNPSTTIKFGLPESGFVDLRVYNMLGQEIASLFNEELSAGYHEASFENNDIASGIYFYKIDVQGKYHSIKKMVLVK